MTRTRSQRAAASASDQAVASAKSVTKVVADASLKIQKNKGTKQVNVNTKTPEKPAVQKTPAVKSAKNTKKKIVPPKEVVYTYEEDMVNLSQFVKKFDIEAVLDQTGNSIGDSHLPRATLNEIIKKALPADVRAQRETMDLICFISNAFVDLLSDTANNVCYSQKKKNIIPEHALRALQKLHLDDYLPFLISDNQNQSLQEIMKSEKKQTNGLNFNFTKPQTDDTRDTIVQQMLKRLVPPMTSLCSECNKKIKKCKCGKHSKEMGLSTQEQIDIQNGLFPTIQSDDSDEEFARQNAQGQTSNETPQPNGQVNGQEQQQPENDPFKQNWIQYNMATLTEEYQKWVSSYIDYNKSQVAQFQTEQQLITDEAIFKQTYPAQPFFDSQYYEYIQNYYAQQQPQQVDSNGQPVVGTDQTPKDANQAQIEGDSAQIVSNQVVAPDQIDSSTQNPIVNKQETSTPKTKDSEKQPAPETKPPVAVETQEIEDEDIDFDEME